MKYDYTFKNNNINYGIINGQDKIVFIKPGLGSDDVTLKDKYFELSCRLKEKYNCHVIMSSNPNDKRIHAAEDKMMLEQYIIENNVPLSELFFFGSSNGCIKGLEMAEEIKFRKMILVNMPLMINFHKTLGYISKIPETEITAVYGTLDPSFKYIPFLDNKFANLKIITCPDTDHNFTKNTSKFITLADDLME